MGISVSVSFLFYCFWSNTLFYSMKNGVFKTILKCEWTNDKCYMNTTHEALFSIFFFSRQRTTASCSRHVTHCNWRHNVAKSRRSFNFFCNLNYFSRFRCKEVAERTSLGRTWRTCICVRIFDVNASQRKAMQVHSNGWPNKTLVERTCKCTCTIFSVGKTLVKLECADEATLEYRLCTQNYVGFSVCLILLPGS